MRFQLKTMALWCLLSVLRDTKTLQSTFPQGTEEEYVIADRCIDIIEGYNPTSDPSLMVPPGLVFACLFALQKLAAMCHRQRKYLCQYALNGAMQFLLPLGQTLVTDVELCFTPSMVIVSVPARSVMSTSYARPPAGLPPLMSSVLYDERP